MTVEQMNKMSTNEFVDAVNKVKLSSKIIDINNDSIDKQI